MASRKAADAAAAVVACRHEVGELLASAALGGAAPQAQRLASSVHLVQTTCLALDQIMADGTMAEDVPPLWETARRAWSVYAPPATSSSGHASHQPPPSNGDLLAAASACVPGCLRDRAQLRSREAAHASSKSLELRQGPTVLSRSTWVPQDGDRGLRFG